MPIFSIIIACYQAGKTLNRCLDSIMNQKFQDYEVILVNDGSTDDTELICHKYVDKDIRFHYYFQNNQGPSSARNRGLKHAMGERIIFIDSDDYIESNFLNSIYSLLQEQNFDLVFYGYNIINSENKKNQTVIPSLCNDKFEDILFSLVKEHIFGYTWSKCFKKNVIKNMYFDESKILFEDELFTCQALKNCQSIGIIQRPLYNYVNNINALTKKVYSDYCKKCDDVFINWKLFINDRCISKNLLDYLANTYINNCYYYFIERKVNNREYINTLRTCEFFNYYIKNHNSNFSKMVVNNQIVKLMSLKIRYKIKNFIFLIINKYRN